MEVLQTSALPLGDGADRASHPQGRQRRATKKPAIAGSCRVRKRVKLPASASGVVGAGNGIRTRDFDLGKVALYH
jgi:hypothetical protein